MCDGPKLPLITKPFSEFAPEEFHQHVRSMYERRMKAGSAKPPKKPSSAVGITLSLTKKGALSVRLSKKKRSFAYVTRTELSALASEAKLPLTQVWNLFVVKKYIIADTRLDAERIYADIKSIPW